MESSRLSRHNKKQKERNVITLVVVLVLIVIFFTSGLTLFINLSSSLGSLFRSKGSDELKSNVQIEALEITDIPEATNSASIVVKANAVNIPNVDVLLNDIVVHRIEPDKDGNITLTIDNLNVGNNKVQLKGKSSKTDKLRVSNVSNVVYTVSKPTIEITEPQDGARTVRSEITVSGKVGEDIEVKVEGIPVVVSSSGNFSTLVKLKEGENKIHITSSDQSGNTDSKELTVIYEK